MFENLVENACTVQSGGLLSSWVPVIDSRGVDRALSVRGGPPLFLQIKARLDKLSFQVALAGIGDFDRWLVAFVTGSLTELTDCYLVPGPALLASAPRGRMADGRECLLVKLEPGSQWGAWRIGVERIGERLLELAGGGPGAGVAGEGPGERSQEEGAYFESLLTALLLRGSDRLCLYRPAVDFEGRDLMAQLAGSPEAVFVQVKGTLRLDVADHPRFQVRRRTLVADPRLLFCFMAGSEVAWLVPAPELMARASAGDLEHLSFEPRLVGADPRWGEFRCPAAGVAGRLLGVLGDKGEPDLGR